MVGVTPTAAATTTTTTTAMKLEKKNKSDNNEHLLMWIFWYSQQWFEVNVVYFSHERGQLTCPNQAA